MPQIIKKRNAFFVLLLVTITCVPVHLLSQSAGKIERRADVSFQNKDYFNAAKLYAAILYDSPLVQRSPSMVYPYQPGNHGHAGKVKRARRDIVVYKLAESYRLYNHYKEALVQYEKYIASQDTHFQLAKLWYGECLVANDEPQKAKDAFTAFLKNYKTKDAFADKARQGTASADFVIASGLRKPNAVVTKLRATVSADGSNFALEKINDSSFWFSSSRHELDKKKEKIFPVRLYTGNFRRNTVEKNNTITAKDLNIAAFSLSPDGLTVYFTGWKENTKAAGTVYTIYYSARSAIDSPWKNPVALPAPVNVANYDSKQPFITKDGRYLLFSSNQPGGYGNYDLWMVAMDGYHPTGAAFNPGTSINTVADEVSPFYDADSSHLYFSSDGRIGMGGMDIYQGTGNPAQNQWTAATNLGPPFNSVRDDQYFRKDDRSDTTYFSSDRASSCCLEIFSAVKLKPVDTLKRDTSLAIVQNKPAAGIKVPSTQEDEKLNRHLMDSINAITVARKYVNYNFASARIRYVDHPQLDEMVEELKRNAALHILIASFTDCIGSRSANILLSRKRSASVKNYLVKKGVAANRINVDFFGKKHFVLPCKEDTSYNQVQQLANRRSDLILTKEQNPKWRPSGRELDINSPGAPASHPPAVNHVTDRKIQADTALRKATVKNTTEQKEIAADKKTGDTLPSVNTVRTGNPAITAKKSNDPVTEPKRITADTKAVDTSAAANTVKANNAAVTAKKAIEPAAGPKERGKADLNALHANKPKQPDSILSTGNETNRNQPVKGKKQTLKVSNRGTQYRSVKNQPREQNEAVTKKLPDAVSKASKAKDTFDLKDKLQINQLLDFTPRLKELGIIEEMTKRIPRKPLLLYSTSDSVRIDLYDNGVFDYDTVSVIYDKKLVSYKQLLQVNKPITFYVKLNVDQSRNEMILFAENLGLTPPNSALMVITDGENKRTEVNVTSDLEHNTVIYFIKVKKEKQ